MAQLIEHSGIINKIDNYSIHVLIEQESACSECHASGVCNAADKENKIIEVERCDQQLQVGDKVILFGKQSIGLVAVLLAFVIPFVLILITLIILRATGTNESLSGGISLAILIPYYSILSIFNKKLKTKFKFEIKKEYEG